MSREEWKKLGSMTVGMFLGVPAVIVIANAVGLINQPLTLPFLGFMLVFIGVLLLPMILVFLFVDGDSLVGVK